MPDGAQSPATAQRLGAQKVAPIGSFIGTVKPYGPGAPAAWQASSGSSHGCAMSQRARQSGCCWSTAKVAHAASGGQGSDAQPSVHRSRAPSGAHTPVTHVVGAGAP